MPGQRERAEVEATQLCDIPRRAIELRPASAMTSVRPMRDTRFFTWLVILAILFSLSTSPVAAADATSERSSGVAGTNAIERLRSAIAASALDETQRQHALTQLDFAASDEQAAAGLRAEVADLRAEATDQIGRIDRPSGRGDADREQPLAEWVEQLPDDLDAESLEGMLSQRRRIISDLSEEIQRVETELAATLARPAERTGEIASLRQRAAALSAPFAVSDEESSLMTDARELRRAAELRRVEAELELRRVEQETSLARQEQHESSLRLMRFEMNQYVRRVEWMQTRIEELARRTLEARSEKLVEQEAAVAGPKGIGASVARENRAMGEELLKQNERLARDREELANLEQSRGRTTTALHDSRTRLELGGASEAVGRWLWSERRRLESPARLRRRLDNLRGQLAELRLRLVILDEDQRGLSDIPAAATALLEARRVESADDGTANRVDETVEPLLRQRVELLALLEPILQRRVTTLVQSESALRELVEATHAMGQLLDRHLLWTPSHAPIDSTWLERTPEGLTDLVKTSRWATTFKLASEQFLERRLVWGGCLLLLVALCELRRRAPARIKAQSIATQQPETDDIVNTWIAFGWTILAALPLPASLALISLLLQTAGTPGRYSDSLGRAFGMLVSPLFVVQLLRWTLIEDGLGHAHFLWKRARRVALRRALPRAAAIVMPMYFVTSLAFIRNLDLPNDVQARVAVVTACVVLAWTFWRLLDPDQAWVQRGVDAEPSTLRKLLRLFIPTGLFVVGVLALAGYVYSAGVLLEALIASINTLVAVGLALALLARWFLVGERRLALRRLETQRQAAEHASTDHGDGVREVEAEITLEQVNAQTRRLLRALRIGLLLIGLVWVWAEVLPAITRLDEIVLWTFSDVAGDGTPVDRPISLMAVLFGVAALALTLFGSRNLPGLVELGLLSQTNIDAASRYAITSILRYVIVISGTLTGLQLFGMRWSQVQWMAAALTVGLGFGLQEIFANFVSGLILLFERPFRVGDVISVGDLSGRVTRIRTRATTILDFDNREIVVPNKNFITDQLLNWTLSDTTTRVTIRVGVAYGSEPDHVHSLLLQAAAEHPLVLREPEPRSLFMAFGGSSLDFELRVFVGTLNDRLLVQSDLHRKITQLFSAGRVEIAFPQLDLHVRELPERSPSA